MEGVGSRLGTFGGGGMHIVPAGDGSVQRSRPHIKGGKFANTGWVQTGKSAG